jgi:FkbM family methyltransferase
MNTEPFREEMRYEYDLTPESLVVDCGGYEGAFAEGICRRYGCSVRVYEPVPEWAERIQERLKPWPKAKVFALGIGPCDGSLIFRIKGDMTGEFVGEGQLVSAHLVQPATVICQDDVDLLKLNIEGGEFAVLETMLNQGLMALVNNLQVQWHDVAPAAELRRNAIIARLSETHELTFDHGWIWQNWRIKNEL